MRTHTAILGLIVALTLSVGLLAACGGAAQTQPPESPQEEQPAVQPSLEDGARLLEERCATCHSLDRVTQAQKTREEWEQNVVRMVSKGAQLNEEEQAILIDYLAETYGP